MLLYLPQMEIGCYIVKNRPRSGSATTALGSCKTDRHL